MSSITTELPTPVFQSMVDLAKNEGVPVERLASMAIAQAVAVWSNQRREFDQRAQHGDRKKFEAALAKVPSAPAIPGDE
jgi:hypothetical protein